MLEDSSSYNSSDQPYNSKKQNTLTLLTDQDSDDYTTDPTIIYSHTDELKDKLKFYKRVLSAELSSMPLGTRVKYVEVMADEKFKYKPGGVITVNKSPTYFVLAANKKVGLCNLTNT